MEHSDEYKQLLDIIKHSVLNNSSEDAIQIQNPERLFQLAKKHDSLHLVGYAIKKGMLTLIDEDAEKKFIAQYYGAMRRVMALEHEISSIREAFEKDSIDFIFLKGAVLRKYYPEECMRVSGDMDVLVRTVDLTSAEKVLSERLCYQAKEKGAHHNHVMSPAGINLDLHFTLTERINSAKPYLDEVWNRSVLIEGKKHEYRMTDEMFYLFHIYHASVHFQMGGCGIRAVLDTWVLNHRIEFNRESRKDLLEKSGLLKFAVALENIAEKWFSNGEDSGYSDIEEYILTGGLAGGHRHVAAVQAQKGSRFKYVFSRIFPPYRTLKFGYPILQKCPILLPFCWIHRLISGAFTGKTKKAKYELKQSKEGAQQSKEIAKLYQKVGLK